jgi:quercetin 2,3-dioxygenase
MTAARGVLHEEYHGHEFTKKGGSLEMVQLWVNLPAKDKMSPPGYQEILASKIPAVSLKNNAGTVRVIAGNYAGTKGAAKTFTPVHLWDIRLSAGHKTEFVLEEGFSAAILVRTGRALVNSSEAVAASELVLFDLKGDRVLLETKEDTECLLISGQPISEPVAGYGPFVMNTRQEIQQAVEDFQQNRF